MSETVIMYGLKAVDVPSSYWEQGANRQPFTWTYTFKTPITLLKPSVLNVVYCPELDIRYAVDTEDIEKCINKLGKTVHALYGTFYLAKLTCLDGGALKSIFDKMVVRSHNNPVDPHPLMME